MASDEVKALAARIEAEYGMVMDPESFGLTYAGYWQRRAGTAIWYMFGIFKGNRIYVNGYSPVRKSVVKRNKIAVEEEGYLTYSLDAYAPGEIGYGPVTR